ncbi:MAG TPA: 30S ribosomal protein THX [Lysobacter sp.]|nr:30S ribosomal protein THX [Lysobacter sp.]
MGKGDRRTAKGKRYNSSYGNARPKSPAIKKAAGATAPVAKKTATKTAAKAPAKKVVAKKTAGKE